MMLAQAAPGEPPVARFLLDCMFKHCRQIDVSTAAGPTRIEPAG
jgi:hypothetical protein